MDYKINTDGSSNDLVIPSGFVIRTKRVSIEPRDDDDYDFVVVSGTYINETGVSGIDNTDVYSMSKFVVEKNELRDLIQLFVDYFEAMLKDAYGVDNVQRL